MMVNLICFLLSVQVGMGGVSESSTQGRITLKANNILLIDLLKAIEKQSDFKFNYENEILSDSTPYSVSYADETIQNVLEDLATKVQLIYQIENNIIRLRKKDFNSVLSLNQKGVQGIVIDEHSNPLSHATIIEENTLNGVISDENGRFSIKLQSDNPVLRVSYIGYEPQNILVKNTNELTVSMTPTKDLDEIVVVGYGSQKKEDITGVISEVDKNRLNNGLFVSAENAIQGKVSGVNVIKSSGEPGAGIDIMIRGIGSIRSGNGPLFVIDGVPLANNKLNTFTTDIGFGSSREKNFLNFLNPQDIASISILKDASATAIYGSRGSNGVILINTKKGKDAQDSNIMYNHYTAISKISKEINLLSAEAFKTLNPEDVYSENIATNWQDQIFRTAFSSNHNLSISKATEKGNYFTSLSYLNQEGIIKKSQFERFSGRFNIENSFFENDFLQTNINFTVSQTKDDGVPTSDNSPADGELITNTLRANPTYPVFDNNGHYFDFLSGFNPVEILDIYNDKTRSLHVLGNLEANFQLSDWFTYKINTGIDKSFYEKKVTIQKNKTFISPEGSYTQVNNESQNALMEHYLTYSQKHNETTWKIMAGHSYQVFREDKTVQTISGWENIGYINPSNNPGLIEDPSKIHNQGFAQKNELQSFFSRIHYNQNNTYLLTASLRADGSTRFGENNKYGYFPSFALGWRLSNENFLKKRNDIKDLKLHISWGQTGNQEVPNKITQSSYSKTIENGAYLNDDEELIEGITLSRTANPNLKWEVVSQFDIGANISLFNGSVSATVDYFHKTTSDAILNITAPAPTFSTIWTNMDGKIINKGMEFSIGTLVSTQSNLVWKVDVNGAFLKNRIKNLPVSQIITGSLSGPGLSGTAINIYKSGYSAGSFLLYKHLGFDDEGKNIIADINNDGVITNSDRIIIGNALPNFTYGVDNYIKYKNIDLSFSFIGQTGGMMYNNTANAFFNQSQFNNGNNVPNYIPKSGESISNTPVPSTLFLEKADYIRLNNLEFGYNFQTGFLPWLKKTKIYLLGQNLFTISNYKGFDPSVNTDKSINGNASFGIDYASYPSSKTIILGTTFTF